MNTTIPDNVLQAAIDEACDEQPFASLSLDKKGMAWDKEKPLRSALARALLALLPEPTPPVVEIMPGKAGQSIAVVGGVAQYVPADGKTPGQVDYEATKAFGGNRAWLEWSQLEPGSRAMYGAGASAVLAAFGQTDLQAAIARMEAVALDELEQIYWTSGAGTDNVAAVRSRLIAAAKEGQPADVGWKGKYEESQKLHNERDTIERENSEKMTQVQARAEKAEAQLAEIKVTWRNQMASIKRLQEELEQAASLPQLRPISEAGPVPEGCVRYYFYFSDQNKTWFTDYCESCDVTHFADIRLPSPEPAVEPVPPTLIPLDHTDIRVTDEFKEIDSDVVETANYWDAGEVDLSYSSTPSYAQLAANYLRRQHGSDEWKPCTKEKK